MELFVAQLLNGLVYGVLLFLMAAGLSLIFGLMNVVSLARGSFFMLGAFIGMSIFQFTRSFWLAFVLAPIPVVMLGILVEVLFLRPLYRRGRMDQVLLTFGFTFVFLDLVQTIWGRSVQRLPVPAALQGTVQIGLGVFSAYRLSLIAFGFAVAVLLWLFLERSRIGAMVRAGVDNAAMAAGLGANIPALFSGVFGFGVALAALGGIAAAPVLGVYPGMDTDILIPAFIVIVIGGMGSLRGAFAGSLLIGVCDTFGKAYFQSIALFLIYLTMITVLLIRPQGLFGIKYSNVVVAPAVTTVIRPGGQLKPTSGRVLLRDRDITGASPERISRLGVGRTFQRNNLFQNLSVTENIRLALQIRHGKPLDFFTPVAGSRGLSERAAALMAQVHLASDGKRIARQLSYGEQRQLEIAVALAGEPALLLLDEPTSGMSPGETARIIDLIAALPHSLTILMIEHDMKVVFSVADRVTVLYYGKVLATGTPGEIQANDRVREVYLGMAR